MDNEKYGIELELITDKFNSKIKKIKKEVNSVSKVKRLEQYSDLSKAPVSAWKQWATESQKVNKSIKQTQNNFKSLQPITEQFAQKTETGLKKVTSNIKRFGLSLLGIRSMWAIASRASSAYLSQDEQLSKRLQSTWVGLGALLAPIIEGLVNIFAKAVRYIAIFIKALTGVDLLAKASAKSIGSTAKATKGLSKALAGFDELTNLDTEAGGGKADLGAGLSGLNDVEINTKWADKIERFGIWVRKNWPLVLTLLGATAAAIAGIKLVGFIASLSTLKVSLGLIAGVVLSIIALVAGITVFIKGIIDYLKNPTWGNFIKILAGLALAVTAVSLLFGAVPALIVAIIGVIVTLGLAIYKHWEDIKATLSKVSGWVYDHIIKPVGDFFTNLFNSIVNWIKDTWNKAINVLSTIKGWINSNVIMPVNNLFAGLWGNVKTSFQKAWNFIMNAFSRGGQIFNGIKEGIVTVFKTVVNNLIRGINTIIRTPFNKINSLLNTIKGINIAGVKPFDGLWGWNPLPIPQIPQLAVGTNYVPEDQLAMIHKGEAVVPKKFNSQEYFGNNDETNTLLRQVIEAVNNIEINPYTTVRDVGKASLSYINSKSRQLGTSVVY